MTSEYHLNEVKGCLAEYRSSPAKSLLSRLLGAIDGLIAAPPCAVPDVPELVRYDLGYDKFEDEWSIVLLASGEYVLYDQATAMISDERQFAIDARNLLQYEKDQQWRERAEAAEAGTIERCSVTGYVTIGDARQINTGNNKFAMMVHVNKSKIYSEAVTVRALSGKEPS